MPNTRSTLQGRTVVAALLAAAAALAMATPAQAGSCPADQVLSEPRDIEVRPEEGIQREILSTVDLTGWRDMGNFMLRTRRLTIAPHGIVPTHRHDDRPSIVYVLNGRLIEHNALCAVPITHEAGEWSPEFGPGHRHWWENPTDEAVVVLSSDVVPFEMMNDDHM
ncbi:MAG: cupin [Alphaproteobacteria bacterium]